MVDGMDLLTEIFAGLRVGTHLLFSLSFDLLTSPQDCGIRDARAGSECRQHAFKPEPDG